MYTVLHFESGGEEVYRKLISDDEIGRQTIILRDASKVSSKLKGSIVIVEGNDSIVEKAIELAGGGAHKLKEDLSEKIYRKIKEEEEQADQGVGFLFD